MDHSPLSDEQLAHVIDRRLRDLPQPKAPRSLAENVMAAIARQKALPWWRRPWVFWPRHLQLIFIGCGLVITSLAVWQFGGLDIRDSIAKGCGTLISRLVFLRPIFLIGSAIWDFGYKMTRLISPATWLAIVGVLAAAYASCLSLGTLCYRLAVRPSNQ